MMEMSGDEALALSKKYTEETMLGAGAIKGDKGEKGDPGTTYTPVIGTVRTVDNLTDAAASVTVNATTKKATFNFDIPTGPQGAEGLQGQQGLQGEKGDTYTPQVGDVLTVDSTLDASVTISLDETNKKATFNFNIPKGADGTKGDKGETGEKGDRGDQGPQGIQGEKGEQGPAGVQGLQGVQGVQGEKGEPGYPFLIYKQYETGIEEFNEADYPEIGLMFMVHVFEEDKGYPVYRYTGDGTATPYSLVTYMNTEGIKGDKGDKGDQGEQGVPGVAGADGVDGITYTPEIGVVNTVESSAGANVMLQVDHDQGRAIYNFDIPKGEDGTNGVDGANGVDGVSPSVEIVPTATGNTVKITDKEGIKSFDVNNGANGTDGTNGLDGINGNDGADGFSPVITVTPTTDGHNVAIEDANGVQNFEVLNGKDCDVQIDDVNDPSENTVWSSKKTSGKIVEVETELKGSIEEINDNLGEKASKEEIKNFKNVYISQTTLGITIVDGQDNTRKVFDALGVGERYQDYWGNSSSASKWGIAESYGNTVQIEIVKVGLGYGVCTAMTNKGITLQRYIDTSMTKMPDWTELATMAKVNALHKETTGFITGSLLGSVVKNANLYYQKFGDNRLVINGWVGVDAVSARTPIFTLPNNWKANSNYLLPCYVIDSNVACACVIDIEKGTVNSYTPLPATLELRFCGEIYLM